MLKCGNFVEAMGKICYFEISIYMCYNLINFIHSPQ